METNKYRYVLYNDGYDIIDTDDRVILTQRDPYAKVFKEDGTYEENAIIHVDMLNKSDTPEPTPQEVLRADIDYLALMIDVDLPSQEGE